MGVLQNLFVLSVLVACDPKTETREIPEESSPEDTDTTAIIDTGEEGEDEEPDTDTGTDTDTGEPVDPAPDCFGDPDSGDEDKDGVCDDLDLCPGDDDAVADLDGDGVCRAEDSCPELRNPEQGECWVIFVDADAKGAGDGSSWADAYPSLWDALAAWDDGAELWVAEGRYVSTETLTLSGGQTLYGGFVGGEYHPDDRPSPLAETLLTGDRSGDDDPKDSSTLSDNVSTVLRIEGALLLDGVSVTGGYQPSTGAGAGIFVSAGEADDVTIRNVRIFGNVGEIMNSNGTGIAIGGSGTTTLSDSVVEGNTGWNGAGVLTRDSAVAILEDVIIRNNTSVGGQGAGMYQSGYSSLSCTGCQFLYNTNNTNTAAGLLLNATGDTTIVNASFVGHTGVVNASAVDIARGGTVIFDNITVTENEGLAFRANNGSDFTLRNGVFWGNGSDVEFTNGSVQSSCAEDDLTSHHSSNVHLDGSSSALGEPFVVGSGGELLLANADAGESYTSACVDLGDGAVAKTFPSWDALTTRSDGVLDGADGDPVDAGMHY